MKSPCPIRRHLLGGTGLVLAAPMLVLPRRSAAATHAPTLAFVHAHTGESLSVAHRIEGHLVPQAQQAIEHLLRDHRTGDTHTIDPDLLDQLATLRRLTGTAEPFQVVSAYRSPRSNERLRARGTGGVAKKSLHLEGRAIDVRLADVPLKTLRDAALDLRAGGVGYYAQSGFVHLDSGRPRHW